MSRRDRFYRILILAVCLMAVLISRLFADELHLKNGAVMEGHVTKQGEEYILEREGMRTVVHASQVVRVVSKPTTRELYRRKADALDAEDFEGHMALGAWCRMRALPDEAHYHFTYAMALQPDSPKARKAAGYKRINGRWVSLAERQKRRGLEFYDGRWRPADEATRLRLQDEREQALKQAYGEAYDLLWQVRKQNDKVPLAPSAAALAEMGTRAIKVLERGAFDHHERVRELVLLTLGRLSCPASRELLIRRLEVERHGRLIRVAAHQLAARSDRQSVQKQLLETLLQDYSKTYRKRIIYVFRIMADKRLIDALIPYADYCPIDPRELEKKKDEQQKRESGLEVSGTVHGSRDIPDEIFYPATEALQYLARIPLAHDPQKWRDWWTRQREHFRFEPVPPLPPRGER